MLFEELIEQHRVHRVVAHGIRFRRSRRAPPGQDSPLPLLRRSNQIAACLCCRSCNGSHRLERMDHFAGFVHRFNLLLEPLRGTNSAELTVANLSTTGTAFTFPDVTPQNAGDKALLSALPDWPIRMRAGLTTTIGATNIDIVVAGGNVRACAEAQSDVVVASRVDIERIQTDGCVEVTGTYCLKSALAPHVPCCRRRSCC